MLPMLRDRILNGNQIHLGIAIYNRQDLVIRRQSMKYIVKFGIAWLVVAPLVGAALAQDVPGIEICTRESRLDRRTGCLQSNVEFLQQVVTKNALDAQQKLSAANRDIAALKEQLAAAGREVAVFKEVLAAMEARLDQLQKANAPAGAQKPEPKPPGK